MFNLKKTGRFLDWKNMEYIDSTPVKNCNGHIVGWMERPVDPAYQNAALKGLKDLQQRYGSMGNYLDLAEIQCKVQANNSIYVSAEGYVLPCCWLAAQLRHEAVRARAEIFDLLEALGGVSHVDGRRRSIREIVEDRFFQRVVPESWSKSSCAAGKLRTCARVCSRDFRRYEAQSPLNRGPVVAAETPRLGDINEAV